MATIVAVAAMLMAVTGVTLVSASDVKCCMADQVQVKLVQTYVTYDKGYFNIGDLVTHMAYDAVNQREVHFSDRSDNFGPRQNYAFYLLYKSNVMYAYHNETGSCVQYPINKPFTKRCVPASAKVLEPTLTYGAGERKDTIKASRFRFAIPRSDGNNLCSTITVTPDCVPILEQFRLMPPGGLMSESLEFTNVNIGTIPDSLFEVPSACSSAPVARPMRFPNLSFDF